MPTRLPAPPSRPLASATKATNASTIAPTATATLTPIGAHDQRRFRLTDKDVGHRTQRFDLADSGDPADPAADPADDPLHDPEVVEDRDEAREEDDHRQNGDREDLIAIQSGEIPKQEL